MYPGMYQSWIQVNSPCPEVWLVPGLLGKQDWNEFGAWFIPLFYAGLSINPSGEISWNHWDCRRWWWLDAGKWRPGVQKDHWKGFEIVAWTEVGRHMSELWWRTIFTPYLQTTFFTCFSFWELRRNSEGAGMLGLSLPAGRFSLQAESLISCIDENDLKAWQISHPQSVFLRRGVLKEQVSFLVKVCESPRVQVV